MRKSNQFTEREIYPYATIDDMRLDLIPRVKKMAVGRAPQHPWKDMEAMDLFKSAGLYDDDKQAGKKGFNLAGILLFGKDEVVRSCAPGIVTDALLRKEDLDRYDDRLYIETNLIEAYDQLIDFISKHTNDPFVLLEGLNVSARSWIARELVSNLLAHREYSKAFNAKLIIERERIYTENWNRSNEHGRIDPENFNPQSKNPIIAKFFMNIGRADQLGSGIRNLYKYTKLYSGGEPELIEGDIFKTIIPLKRESNGADTMHGDMYGDMHGSTMQDLAKDTRIAHLLEFCKKPRSRDEIQRSIGITNRDYFSKSILKPLLESGQLRMTIPDIPKSPNQKYVRT